MSKVRSGRGSLKLFICTEASQRRKKICAAITIWMDHSACWGLSVMKLLNPEYLEHSYKVFELETELSVMITVSVIQYPSQTSICKLCLLCCIAEMAVGHSRLESHLAPYLWKPECRETCKCSPVSGTGYRQIGVKWITIIYRRIKCVSPVIDLHPTGCGIARKEKRK